MATIKLADLTINKKEGTVLTLSTEGKYAETDVSFNIGVKAGATAANTASADITAETTAGTNATNITSILGSKATSEPSSGYYIRMKASGSGSSKVTTAGWVATGTLAAASTTATKYYPVTAATITQNAPTVNSSGLVTATVTTTAGYTPANSTAASNTLQLSTQSGKTVSPTESEQTAVASGKYTTGAVKVGAISKTYVGSSIARNDSTSLTVSGKTITAPAGYYASDASADVVVGTVTSGSATISSASYAYNSSSGKFDVTGSASISAPTVNTAGYISSSEGTLTGNTATLNTSVAKIVGSTSITGASTKKPSITKQSTPSGVTNAASGDATTTAPTSGVYVAVKSAANTGTLTATPSVTTSGYGTSANHSIAGATQTVGASASDTTYVPITVGSVTANAPTVDSSGLVTATTTVTAGYVATATPSNTLQLSTMGAQTKYATTSDQTISTTGKYMTGNVVVKKLSSTNYSAANIKNGVTIKVNNSSADVYSVTGTFTKANTVSSGQTAAAAAQIRSGYSAWVDGAEVKGSIANTSITQGDTTVSSGTATRGTATWSTGYITSGSIGAATFANEGTTDITYVDISDTTEAPVLVAGDYLYINKGYTDNLKISLAKLVPDGSDVAGHGDYILSGHSAYDNDGTLVAGTIPTKTALTVSGKTVTAPAGYYASNTSASVAVGTVTSGTASITALTKTYNSTSGKFDFTATADVSAPTVGTAGYISSSEGTRNKKTGGATVNVAVDKIVVTTAMSGTTTKKPSITKRDVPSGVVQAASGNATTTAPSSGVYVAVKSDATTGTITATPSVVTAGYGDATNNGVTGNTATVGASASDTTYIPITTTSASVSGKTVSYGTGWITGGSKSVAVGTVTSGSANITSAAYAYNSTNGNFDVTGSASIGAPSVGTAGYISSSEGTRNGNTATLTTTVDKIVGSTSITGTSTKTPSITKQDVPSGVTQAASGNATTTAPSSGVYVAVKSAANTGTLTATPSVTTAGYGTADNHGIAGATKTVGANASAMTYIPITTTTASVSGKTVSYGSGWITAGSKSVAVGTVTSSGATINSATYTYNSTNGNFDVTGSASIAEPTVDTAGYISSTEGTRNGNTANLSTTVAKVVGSVAITGANTKKPTITKQDVPSGVTQAASGAATTTAPSSGVYVAVKSAANTGTLTATPSVTTAGYGTADNHGITGNSATVGASASDTTYVPITTTTASVSGKTVSYGSGWITAGSKSVADGAYSASVSSHSVSTTPVVTGATSGTVTDISTTTKPSSGTDGTNYWTITPGGSVTTTGVSSAKGKATIGTTGYITAGNKESSASTVNITPTVNNGTARYITKATTSTSNGTATVTAGTASTSVTGMVTTSTDTGYSVSASATGGNASLTASSATVGAGYNPSSVTASTSAKSATGENASDTQYIQKGVLSASVSSNSGGSASMAATGFTAASSSTSYYVTLSTSAGSVKAKASVGTEGYVKSETNETAATSVSVSGNGTKLYIPAGAYAGSVSSHSITTTPVVTGALSGKITTIGTTTKPSGTDGTDYWSVTPGGSVTTTGVSTAKGKATISTAGYIPTGNNESSAHTVNITPTVSNGTTRYLTKATTSTSSGTATATAGSASTSVTGMVTTTTNTGYSVSATATGGSASVTASSVTVGTGYNPSSVTASTTAQSSTGDNASQTKYIQKGVLAAAVSSNTAGSASMAATGFTASSSATSYYVTLSTSAGSVKAKASVGTEGYVKTETQETSATSVSVSGNGTKLYIPATSVSQGTTTVSNTTATRGTATWGNGYLASGSIGAATFANEATSGKTYVDISGTTAAPVLVAGDYLYINKGYTDDLKISLARLVPDGSDVKGHGEYILSGHSAYDNDGTLVAGSIATMSASDISVNGATVTLPTGMYTGGTAITKTISSGAVTTSFTGDGMSTYFNSGTSSDKNVTITPKYTNTAGYIAAHSSATNNGGTAYYKIKTVSGSIGGSASGGSATAAISNVNSMAVITDISGKTAGTDYWTVKATATGAKGTYTPKYTVSTAGWISSTVTGTAQDVSVSSDSTGKSIYIPKAAIAGSSTNATATTTVAPGTVSVAKQSVPSGVTNAASGDATTTAPSSGVYIAVKATAAANSTGTTSSISGSGTATVSSAGYAPTTLTGSVSVSGTATAKTSAKDSSVTYVPITTATPAFTGGALSGTATASSSTATLNDSTNNSGISLTTACTATRAKVTYNGAVNGWVTKSSGADAYAGTSTAMTAKTYYINGVTMAKPSSGSRTFSVVAPDTSNVNHTYLFTVDNTGNTTIKIDNTCTIKWNETDKTVDFIYT